MNEKFYTIKEIANMLKVTSVTIRRLLKKGALSFYKIGGIKISEQDLEQYLNNVKSKNNKEV